MPQPVRPTAALAEPLESRLMLATHGGALARLGALGDLFAQYRATGDAPASQNYRLAGNSVTFSATASGDASLLERDLRKLGATVSRAGDLLSGTVPVSKLGAMAKLRTLASARPSLPITNAGLITQQGDISMRSAIARSLYSLDGSGVKIGILSDSFDTGPGSYAADVTSGDLPAGITILKEYPAGTDEGRAMAQLIHDVAPGAQMYFYSAYYGEADFANGILALASAGCDIIVDDVGYLEEPMFQDGVVAQAVDTVAAQGVAYFSAAGNQGREAYDTTYRAGNTYAPGAFGPNFGGGVAHDFDPGPGVDDMQAFTLGAGQALVLALQWDQPFASAGGAGAQNDLDLYVLNAAGTSVLTYSDGDNISGGNPIEIVQYQNTSGSTQTYNLMLTHYAGPAPSRIKYISYYLGDFTEYQIDSPTVTAHAAALGGLGVASAPYYTTPAYGVNPPQAASYSSSGPSTILFDTAGNRLLTPQIRHAPEITAVDGVDTTFFGFPDFDNTGYPNFFGTSAAAPNAAAVAALLLQARPHLTPAQVYSALETTTIDMDDFDTIGFDVGLDNKTGYGLIQADAAVASILPTATVNGTVYRDENADGARAGGEIGLAGWTVYADLNSSGSLDGGDAFTTTNGSGDYTLSSLPAGAYPIRIVQQATWVRTAPATGTYSLVLNPGQTVSAKDFAQFPTFFAGTSAADTYVVRLNVAGTRVEIDENQPGGRTFSAPVAIVPSLSFSTGLGDDLLTINSTNGSPVPAGGISFDGSVGTNTLRTIGTGNTDPFAVTPTQITRGAGTPVTYANTQSLQLDSGDYTAATDLAGKNVFASGSRITFSAGQHLLALGLSGGTKAVLAAGGTRNLVVTGLAVTGAATQLDLTDNALIVDYSGPNPLAAVSTLIYSGRNGVDGDFISNWDGGGIVSSVARSNSLAAGFDLYTVGSINNIDLTDETIGRDIYSSFRGQSVDGTSVLVRYTYSGDADLNGFVDGDDYALIDNAYLNLIPHFGFMSGDFNYDGLLDGDDYGLIDSGYLFQGPPLL